MLKNWEHIFALIQCFGCFATIVCWGEFLNLAIFLPYKCEFNIQFYEKVFGFIAVGSCVFVML